ncbi:hypothetical protein TNCV_3661381 [Trichonephila clavipes]|nr:hypothetical protein TNCV_3661381 [Trichonephila clavipes]
MADEEKAPEKRDLQVPSASCSAAVRRQQGGGNGLMLSRRPRTSAALPALAHSRSTKNGTGPLPVPERTFLQA